MIKWILEERQKAGLTSTEGLVVACLKVKDVKCKWLTAGNIKLHHFLWQLFHQRTTATWVSHKLGWKDLTESSRLFDCSSKRNDCTKILQGMCERSITTTIIHIIVPCLRYSWRTDNGSRLSHCSVPILSRSHFLRHILQGKLCTAPSDRTCVPFPVKGSFRWCKLVIIVVDGCRPPWLQRL